MKATHTPPILDLDTGMTPADLLRNAALYLRRHGRITGEFFDLLADSAFPPACTLGAINICAHGRAILCSDDGSDFVPAAAYHADDAYWDMAAPRFSTTARAPRASSPRAQSSKSPGNSTSASASEGRT